jgi:hypothetical protein
MAIRGYRTSWRRLSGPTPVISTDGFYHAVAGAMSITGFTPDEIGRIGGGNFLRVFGEAVKK